MADTKTTRVDADYVLAWNGTDHVILREAVLVYRGEEIIYVGHDWDGDADEVVDCSGSLVMPGLIDLNALADIDHCLLDSWRDHDVVSYNWSPGYARSPVAVFDRDERATVREFAVAQLARHGITTFMPIASEVHSEWAETYGDFVDVSAIARRIGVRGYMGPSYRAGVNVVDGSGRDVFYDARKGETGLADAVAFLDYALSLDSDLVHGVLLPCRIETMNMELLKETARVARERDVSVRIHCLQDPEERRFTEREWGMGVVDALESSGLLEADLLVPHGWALGDLRDPEVATGADVARLAAAGVPVVYCPLTSARYGDSLLTFDAFESAGLKIVLGTDSFPPDLIRGIDAGVAAAKVAEGSLSAGRVEAFVRACTCEAADVLGRPDLGRLTPGAKADFIVADLDDFAMGVVDDPVRTFVVNGSARDISRTVVAGRTVMVDGEVPGAGSVRDLKARAQSLFGKMRSAYSDRDYAGRDPDTLFPPSFSAQ
jgi:8-oxoguanine deaminase